MSEYCIAFLMFMRNVQSELIVLKQVLLASNGKCDGGSEGESGGSGDWRYLT